MSPEEAERGTNLLRDSVERSLGGALSGEQAQAQSLLDNVFADNGLRQQNIPLYGSRIRIQGRNIPERSQLTINGESYPVDLERKFAAEFLLHLRRQTGRVVVAAHHQEGAGQQLDTGGDVGDQWDRRGSQHGGQGAEGRPDQRDRIFAVHGFPPVHSRRPALL